MTIQVHDEPRPTLCPECGLPMPEECTDCTPERWSWDDADAEEIADVKWHTMHEDGAI